MTNQAQLLPCFPLDLYNIPLCTRLRLCSQASTQQWIRVPKTHRAVLLRPQQLNLGVTLGAANAGFSTRKTILLRVQETQLDSFLPLLPSSNQMPNKVARQNDLRLATPPLSSLIQGEDKGGKELSSELEALAWPHCCVILTSWPFSGLWLPLQRMEGQGSNCWPCSIDREIKDHHLESSTQM